MQHPPTYPAWSSMNMTTATQRDAAPPHLPSLEQPEHGHGYLA